MTDSINNSEDFIDSRDVENRIDDLEDSLMPWRAMLRDFAGIDKEEEYATYSEATEALAEWLREHGEYNAPEADKELFDDLATEIESFDHGTLWEGGIGRTGLVATIESIALDDDDVEELAALKALREEVGPYTADWHHGETLIRESYFSTYAQELASDLHGDAIRNASWPFDCIDWDEAAEKLKQDYTEVEFDGVTYLIR